MNKKEICIVIPIYKESLDDFEIQSVEQCVKVLSDYTIHFVCPKRLNIDFYKAKFSGIINFTFFDNFYFEGVEGYNKLMLSVGFYKKFDKYKYMLVYQTDCYVFNDELLQWANKGYDYIGGIWFEGFVGEPYLGSELWQAGNGGFSLRKIKSIRRILTSKKPIKNMQQLIMEKKKLYKNGKINFLKEFFWLPSNILGYQNNFNYQAKLNSKNEDVFFMEAYLKYNGLRVPNIEGALLFSWDRCPAFLYEKLNQFPFGCHAWFKEDFPYEENKEFWSKHIKLK